MLRRFARNRPLTCFYLLALLIATGVVAGFVPWMRRDPVVADLMPALWRYLEQQGLYGNLLSIGSFALAVHPAAFLIFVFAGAPTIAALVVAALGAGRTGLSRLLDRLRPWRDGVSWRQGLTVYGALATVYLGIAGLYLLVAAIHGEPGELDRILAVLGGTPIAAVVTLLLGPFIDEGGTLEELGWRGFALPRLLDRTASPLGATLLLGVLWWAWHLPREVGTVLGGVGALELVVQQGKFLITCLALSVVISYFFQRTGGSAWAGILIHGGSNVWSKALAGPANRLVGEDARTLVMLAIAVVILTMTGTNLGRRT